MKVSRVKGSCFVNVDHEGQIWTHRSPSAAQARRIETTVRNMIEIGFLTTKNLAALRGFGFIEYLPPED